MTHAEYQRFHDATNKVISANISFAVKGNHVSLLAATKIPIQNSLGLDAKLEIHYSPEDDAKIFLINIVEAGGAVCRLCVDNGPHPPCMFSHKHALRTPECPKNRLNLELVDRRDLDGKPIDELFRLFCQMTNITHTGTFTAPNVD